ncbi:rhomboid family intramembrane serine protease [Stenotrophomonas sp. STM01]|uniref:rhomboid family intramembrane serine protease n=1 Tax=Stenotrophomonas sp. STM01 TaxID=2769278 RepID=UPI00177B54C5|nr:rhomboid family intramembrane serine protease [Stenotrophomonas sp. STM01]MBD9534774.1 rhomboid family intramembrane serine protease [Stenotrophomonas sp. STM01]
MFPRLPKITRTLLIANVALFLLQQLPQLAGFLDQFMLWPLGSQNVVSGSPGFEPWQLLTYGFLHGSFGHVFFNMLMLWFVGAPLEMTWGEKRFLTFYLVCVAGAGLCQLLVTALVGEYYPVLGASGGVFGLLMGYGMIFGNRQMRLLFPPVTMTARTLVILMGVSELVLGYTGWQPGVAHFAHLGGMLFGWLLIRHWRKPPPSNNNRGRHLRSVK